MNDELEAPDDPNLARVRAGVLGAPAAPRLTVIEGGGGASEDAKNAAGGQPSEGRGGGGGRGNVANDATVEGTCPLVCLGHADGEFHFLDVVGQRRSLKSRALVARGDLVSLFLGDTRWLFQWFPNIVRTTREGPDGAKETVEEVRGFSVSKAGERLMAMCRAAGLYGSHVQLRAPGVWAGEAGAPIVHAGDLVMIDGAWRPTGFRSGDQVWSSAPRRPRPGADADGDPLPMSAAGFAAGPEVAQDIQREIGELWQFRLAGSEIVCIGLMAVGYFGAAATWRPNGYLIGGTGSGKSMLLQCLRAGVPHAQFSTDTSKAGIEGKINGVPSPVYIDEAGDRQGHGAQVLLDVVLSASSGEGTRGLRGAADGKTRDFHVMCSVIMAAVSPPQMGPQHRDRFTVVHLVKPGAGADNRDAMEVLTRRVAAVAPMLWGRALQGWPRWVAARLAFRAALSRSQCAPRELDQIGAILAAWWVLTEDGVPEAAQADDGVRAVAEFIRGAAEVAADDGPRRVVQFLASTTVQRDRSTDIEQIGVLVERVWAARDEQEREAAQRLLERFGIRMVREHDLKTPNGKLVPRGYFGDGMWFSKSAETLRRLFLGSPFEGDRWIYELGRHPTAVEPKKNVRVGGVSGPAVWLSRADWLPPGDDEGPPPDE
jgi:hypothetical protein